MRQVPAAPVRAALQAVFNVTALLAGVEAQAVKITEIIIKIILLLDLHVSNKH